MKNKNLSLLAIALFTLFSVTLTSCGGEDEDPKPTKTDLELVKEGIVGTWSFVSAEITKDNTTLTYNGGCDFSGQPSWYQANAKDTDYTFINTTSASKHRNCSNETVDDLTYTISELNGVFTITVSDNAVFEIITPVEDIDGNIVKVKHTPLLQGVSSNILTFSK